MMATGKVNILLHVTALHRCDVTNVTEQETRSIIDHLRMPAAMRNPMSVVKPAQTPASPNTRGAYNKTNDDITPTTICGIQTKSRNP